MPATRSEFPETVTPTEADSQLAVESSRRLSRFAWPATEELKSPRRTRRECDRHSDVGISAAGRHLD